MFLHIFLYISEKDVKTVFRNEYFCVNEYNQ